jgi:ABC-type transporter Mla MlaB component
MTAQSIKQTLAEDGKTAVIKAAGRINIEMIAEMHHMLLVALCEAEKVQLDFQEVEEMDITALQILCSACKTAAVQKRPFTSLGELPECLGRLAKVSGVHRNGICKHNADQFCNWFGGIA